MSGQRRNLLSPEEYLALERAAEYKNEYHEGEMFAMSGASRQHSTLMLNIAFALRSRLRGRCTVFSSDMRVQMANARTFVYPDVSVACGEPRFRDDAFDTLLNPAVVVEILSRSTEAYDRGLKSENYRKIASLHTYILISQDRFHVEVFFRNEAGSWTLTEADGKEAAVEIPGVGLRIPMEEIYEDVSFD